MSTSLRSLSLRVLAFPAFNILLKERGFHIKKGKKSYLSRMLSSNESSSDYEAAETDVEYDLEVEVSSNASEQKDTSDDELEDAYANEPLADENWLAQYEAERKKEQEIKEKLQR